MKYTLSILVENRAGVLSRVVSLFSRRGYNIDSLVVAATDDPTVSRMTICGQGDNYTLEQMEKQLNKIVPVIKVRSLGAEAVRAELMLIRVACDPQSLAEINEIAKLMKAEAVDVNKNAITLKFSGGPEQCDALIELLRPYKIKEMSRSGAIALE